MNVTSCNMIIFTLLLPQVFYNQGVMYKVRVLHSLNKLPYKCNCWSHFTYFSFFVDVQ